MKISVTFNAAIESKGVQLDEKDLTIWVENAIVGIVFDGKEICFGDATGIKDFLGTAFDVIGDYSEEDTE